MNREIVMIETEQKLEIFRKLQNFRGMFVYKMEHRVDFLFLFRRYKSQSSNSPSPNAFIMRVLTLQFLYFFHQRVI